MGSTKKVSRLDHHLGYWLRFVSNHVSHAFMQKLEAKGVTVAEWAVMRQLLELGPVSPSVLAEQMGMTRGAVSKLIERLCEKEFVTRSINDLDRRYQTVQLTKSGGGLVPRLAQIADQNDSEFFGHLSQQDQKLVTGLLKEIVDRNGWKDLPVS